MFYKGFRNKMRFRWQEEHEINIDLIFFRKWFFDNNNACFFDLFVMDCDYVNLIKLWYWWEFRWFDAMLLLCRIKVWQVVGAFSYLVKYSKKDNFLIYNKHYHCCFWIGKNNLNSGGSYSSLYNLSEKYILLILQFAWIVTRSVSM